MSSGDRPRRESAASPKRGAATTRFGSDLPVAAAEDRHALPGCRDAVDLELRRADHEIDVGRALVDARGVGIFDEEREATAERDVAGRGLIQEGVVEDG